MSETPKPKRRWFQFSLRTLLGLTLLVGIGMATWLVPLKKRAERQKAAVEAIESDSGSVWYDFQVDPSGQFIAGSEPPGPVWLRTLLGTDFFTNVVGILVNTPADMRHAMGLGQLRVIGAYGVPLTDADLESVRDLGKLRSLDLSLTNVTNAGMNSLKSLRELEDLTLSVTRVTDQGLEHLKGLSNLKTLNLNDTRITDRGLESLSGLSRLQELTLSHTNVTDAGLESLKALTQLQMLNVWHTQVTDEGVKKLQQALPNCKIHLKTLP